MTAVVTYSYTHSVTYVTDKLLKSLKDIIILSGLDPAAFVADWATYTRGIKTWLESGHLETLELEVFNPTTDKLITKWDIAIVYSWVGGDGSFWTDTEQLKYAIKKSGVLPSQAKYRVVVNAKPGRPDVDGWITATSRSTDGMVRQSLGTTVEHSGLGGQAAYWRAR